MNCLALWSGSNGFHLTIFYILFMSTEQSHISDVPLWKSDWGPLQNQTGMCFFFFFLVLMMLFHYSLTYNWVGAMSLFIITDWKTMFLSFQGWPGFTSHGLGDKWASWRGLSCNQSWAERPREHSQGSSGESPWLERWWKHQDSGADLSQYGSAKELWGRNASSVSSHHVPGMYTFFYFLYYCTVPTILQVCSLVFTSYRSLENSYVVMQNQHQSRRRKTCFHHLKEKTRSALMFCNNLLPELKILLLSMIYSESYHT